MDYVTDRSLRHAELPGQLPLGLKRLAQRSPDEIAHVPSENDLHLPVGECAGSSDRALHDRLPYSDGTGDAACASRASRRSAAVAGRVSRLQARPPRPCAGLDGENGVIASKGAGSRFATSAAREWTSNVAPTQGTERDMLAAPT